MEIGSGKPIAAHSLTMIDSGAANAKGGTDTVLPPSQSVQPLEKTDTLQSTHDRRADEQSREIKRQVTRDEETASFVFRAMDEASGEILRQIPEEAILRLRQALQDVEPSPTPQLSRTL